MVNLVGKFAKVNSDAYEEYGLARDTSVFIAGSGFSPIDDNDTYKLLFVVAKVGPEGKPEGNGVTIARSSLDVLSDEDSVDLKQKMENALADKEAASEEGR